MQKTLIASTFALLALTTSAMAEKVKFEYWYGLTGQLGDQVQATCDRFNASQGKYEISCVSQGDYATALQNTIAAFRAKKHPTIVQGVEVSAPDLMLSGQVYPAYKLMEDHGFDINWDSYFPGIANYYADSQGRLWSMPFNSSTAMMYWNVDAYKSIGRDEAPKTWEEYETVLRELKEAGSACPAGYAPSSWVDLEQFSMVHGEPIATKNNGYDGLDAEVVFNTTLHAKHMKDIKRWIDEGLLVIKTRETGLSTRDAFAAGECAHFFGSIASHQAVTEQVGEGFLWDVAMLPVYEGTERKNSVVGGASLWTLSGKTEEQYRGAAEYFQFLAKPESAEFWSTVTGYIPVTDEGFDYLVKKGFYDERPYKGREKAIESLTYSPVTPLTRGIRLGNFVQIRAEWTSQMQAVLSGQKTPQEALDDAAKRSNTILRKFERTYNGKTLP